MCVHVNAAMCVHGRVFGSMMLQSHQKDDVSVCITHTSIRGLPCRQWGGIINGVADNVRQPQQQPILALVGESQLQLLLDVIGVSIFCRRAPPVAGTK